MVLEIEKIERIKNRFERVQTKIVTKCTRSHVVEQNGKRIMCICRAKNVCGRLSATNCGEYTAIHARTDKKKRAKRKMGQPNVRNGKQPAHLPCF